MGVSWGGVGKTPENSEQVEHFYAWSPLTCRGRSIQLDLHAKWQFVDLLCRNGELLSTFEKKTNTSKIVFAED